MGQGLSELLLATARFAHQFCPVYTDLQEICLSGVFLHFIIHVAFPRGFREGLSLLMAVIVWTSLRWSLLAFAEDISQGANPCCVEKQRVMRSERKDTEGFVDLSPPFVLPWQTRKTC